MFLTSKTLVDSVRRRCSIPKSDSMFDDTDILEFANQELLDTIIPLVKSNSEEYLLWSTEVDLVPNVSKYTIPERAIGSQLRDISYVDTGGQEHEMTRIMRDNRYSGQMSYSSSKLYQFYVEGDGIVLVPSLSENVTGKLKFVYIIRPNKLVESDRVSKVTAINEGFVQVANISNGAVTTFVTSEPHELSNNESVNITTVLGVDAASITGIFPVTIVDTITFTINVDSSALAPLSGGLVYNNTKNVVVNELPIIFGTTSSVDFIRTRSPHSILQIDVLPRKVVINQKIFNFKTVEIPSSLIKGDTIALSGETDVPTVPTELHYLLLNKVCERTMESLGDQQGFAVAKSKSTESIGAMNIMMDNRVDSAPLKVVNKHSLLKSRRNRNRRF